MAKLNRNALKSLIKECLVEILSEGLGETAEVQLTEARQPPRRKKRIPRPQQDHQEPRPRRPALDSISYKQRVEDKVSGLTSDPIMASIFKDTASTTLQEQASVNSNRSSHVEQVMANGDAAAQAISGADPSDLFGDAASNWATLAFS